MRKSQRGQGLIPRLTMGQLTVRPLQETFTVFIKKAVEGLRLVDFPQRRFLLLDHIEINQRQFHLVQAALTAQQSAVYLQLRPMQHPMVGGLPLQIATKGFDFFQAVTAGIVTIGPATHMQVAVVTGQGYFPLITLTATAGDGGVPGNALLSGGRRGETQIQVAAFGGELRQGAHRHGIAAHSVSRQRT